MFGKKYLIYFDITTNKNYIINITTTTSTISIYDNDGNRIIDNETITNKIFNYQVSREIFNRF